MRAHVRRSATCDHWDVRPLVARAVNNRLRLYRNQDDTRQDTGYRIPQVPGIRFLPPDTACWNVLYKTETSFATRNLLDSRFFEGGERHFIDDSC